MLSGPDQHGGIEIKKLKSFKLDVCSFMTIFVFSGDFYSQTC